MFHHHFWHRIPASKEHPISLGCHPLSLLFFFWLYANQTWKSAPLLSFSFQNPALKTLCVSRFYWGYETLNGFTSPHGLAPSPPLCFLRFLIPSTHLLCFILQSSLALLPSWALGLVLCLQRSLVYSAKGRTICSNWGKWQRLYHVALSFLSPVGKGRMEVLIFSLMGYAPGLHLQPWKAGILDFT